ncbi:MAG: hypothetical protein R3C10_25305 [Pirellulales bacterium]
MYRSAFQRMVWIFVAIAAVYSSTTCRAVENLLRNGSFEQVPGFVSDQGVLPGDWIHVDSPTPGADTYSTDGSYGLATDDYPHFVGKTAYDGTRWVAASHGYSGCSDDDCRPEQFGQFLTTALSPGGNYLLSAALLQSQRPDVDHAGGYQVILADGVDLTTSRILGSLEPTTDANEWETRTLSFTAPADAGSLPLLLLMAYSASEDEYSYTGIDGLVLRTALSPGDANGDGVVNGLDYLVWAENFNGEPATSVPEPACAALLVVAMCTCASCRQRKRD